MGLAQRFRAMPEAGGVMDQPIWVLRMLRILDLAEGESSPHEPRVVELADLQELLV